MLPYEADARALDVLLPSYAADAKAFHVLLLAGPFWTVALSDQHEVAPLRRRSWSADPCELPGLCPTPLLLREALLIAVDLVVLLQSSLTVFVPIHGMIAEQWS